LEVVKFHVNNLGVTILGDDDSYTLLHSAARYGNLTVCKLLLQHSKKNELKNSVDRNGWTPLQYAAKNGHFATCELLFPYFRDKCHFDNVWTLGHFAMKNGDSGYWQEIGKGLKSVGPKTLAYKTLNGSSKTVNKITPLQLIALHLCKSIQGGDSATF
jgi:ankyrin repeat protein